MKETPLLYKMGEAAMLLGISRSTLWRLIGQGAIGFVKIDDMKRIERREIERFIEKNRVKEAG